MALKFARVIQFIIGAMLLYAAGAKAWDGTDFVQVMEFNGVSKRWIPLFFSGLIIAEVLVGQLLIAFWRSRTPLAAACTLFVVFTAQLGYLATSDAAPSCGCFGRVLESASGRQEAIVGIARNLVILAGLASCFFLLHRANGSETGSEVFAQNSRTPALRQVGLRGFSLLELLIVIGIVSSLIAVAIPTLIQARKNAERVQCLSHLRTIGHAMATYATNNSGIVPRAFTVPDPHDPNFGRIVESFVHGAANPNRRLWEVRTLRCPSHPIPGIDTGFVVNALVSWDVPHELGSRYRVMSRLNRVQSPASVPYFLDAANIFRIEGPVGDPERFDGVFFIGFHSVSIVPQLPGQSMERVPVSRHGRGKVNALFFDFHAETMESADVTVQRLSDGDLTEDWARIPLPRHPRRD
jgi:prepilin-type N-terminal cleavage/methylation domain-containing protein/prepilin-type processing-associated H-X9-DG protein